MGQSIPFTGEYGCQHPESITVDEYRVYFVDRARGSVLRLSKDGLTPISSIGMVDWFSDHLKSSMAIIGSIDDKKSHYNITMHETINLSVDKNVYTLSFNETTDGWTSFKSYIKETGLSLNNKYYTFKNGRLYLHHSDLVPRNNFYGVQYDSTVTSLINMQPSIVKAFSTVKYEGSQARINKSITDDRYDNVEQKYGWEVELIKTDMQEGVVEEFVEKEGKWYNNVKGKKRIMALDTSKINLQGVGTLSANAIMVEGSNPSSSFNVVISIPSEGQNWSCETVTLSNVSSLSGTTTLNIRANSGFQVNASMFTALGFIGSSTYFTNVTFSNTSSIIDTANEVLVTIEWATQSISEDINIQFNGIVTTEALQGVNYFNTLVNITHPGATAELFDVSEGLDVSTLSSQADSTVLRLEGSVPEPFMSATTQIFKLRLTISEAGFTYSDHPEVSISSIGNSYSEEQYNITTSQSSGSEQVMFAYYQPNLYLNNGVGYQDHINIYATAFGQQVTIINEDSGNQQNYFHVTDDIPDNGVLSQTSSVGIISHGYVIGEIHAFSSLTTQTPSNYANWITNIQYNPSVLNNYSGTISFTVADNTTIANRSAYFTVFDGGSITPQTLTTFQVEQSRLSFVSFTVSTDTLSDALGGNILTNSNLGISVTDEVLILPTKSCTFDIVGVIEIATDFNSVPGAASGAEGHIENNLLFIEDSIGDSTNNSWATIDSVTITGSNTFNASVSINANSNNGDPQRGVYIKFKHPLDPDNISTIEVEQQRAFDPALDTLTVRKQETSGSFISQDGLLVPYINEDEGYYVDGDLIPSGTITKESTDTITMLQIQVGDNGLPLIDLPKVKN